jgi:hypothetical protein
MYKAYISRASQGDLDNTPIIDKVRGTQQQQMQM